MKLSVVWVNASRNKTDTNRVALTFRNAVLDFFNGVENAEKAFSYYQRNPQKPFQDFPYAYHNAFRRTNPLLSPWESGHTTFKISFIKDR